jgi:outer membrane receptor for ferric coprogen and ferric-rhodotorulic acid
MKHQPSLPANARPARHTLLPLACCLLSALQPFSPSALSQAALSQPAPAPDLLDDDIVEMSTFNVTETRSEGYDSRYTTAGMRTSQELRNIPSSLSVINSTLIADIAALDTAEMSKWFVTGETNPDPAYADRPLFRGIQSNYAMRNGWIWYSGIDSYSIDRVELIRGPNSFLYGEADLGGINNTITRQALFKKSPARVTIYAGSHDLIRAQFDINKMLSRYVAIRADGVYSKNHDWFDFGSKEFYALYVATTIRPTRTTTIRINAEASKSDRYVTTGLFSDGYSYFDNGSRAATSGATAPATYTTGAYYTPYDNTLLFNANAATTTTRPRYTGGANLAIADPGIIPKTTQFRGPDSHSTYKQASISFELEQQLGSRLSFMLSGNIYQRESDDWTTTGKTIYRDINPTLPSGADNPYYNELYTEYYRQHQLGGNIVRDIRASLVYNWNNLKWIKQQFVLNIQQHQDTPGQKDPKLAEFLDPNLWTPGNKDTFNNYQAATPAAMNAMYGAFNNNHLYRRYYLKDGNSPAFTASTAAVPGISAYYPDYGGSNAQTSINGAILHRRFYTPSHGIGAAGSYFGGLLTSLVGYRKDKFHMSNIYGIPEVYSDPNSWNIRPYADGSGHTHTDYEQISRNAGATLHLFKDRLTLVYNYAQSTRMSLGDGRDGLLYGTKQGLPTGEGTEMGLRYRTLRDTVQLAIVYYDNYQPNDRVTLSMSQDLLNKLNSVYTDLVNPSFDARGDTQKRTTKGWEGELTASITRNWRVTANFATNKMVTEDRVPQLKHICTLVSNDPSFAGSGDPAMQSVVTDLQNLLATFPEGAPVGGYTKYRANVFTRYDFRSGALKGIFLSGGANWRDKTYRGTVNTRYNDLSSNTDVWAPSYTTVSVAFGYRTRIFNRNTSIQVNIDNLLGEEYYRSASASSGTWGDPRTFKLIIWTEF